jgi:DNA-binding GntR family transcriptional regulator
MDDHGHRQGGRGEPTVGGEPTTDGLRRDILAGTFAPGERLVELQLTKRYGVGRAAVRSALIELAAEGLVEREANRGAVVRRMSLTEVIQITEARSALEGLLASQAALRATDEEREELLGIERRMRRAVTIGEHVEYSELNALLHRRIREVSRHTVASDLVANLKNRAARHQYRLALLPGRPDASLGQHADIVHAIVAGDEEAAGDAMRIHLQSVLESLRQWGELGLEV